MYISALIQCVKFLYEKIMYNLKALSNPDSVMALLGKKKEDK